MMVFPCRHLAIPPHLPHPTPPPAPLQVVDVDGQVSSLTLGNVTIKGTPGSSSNSSGGPPPDLYLGGTYHVQMLLLPGLLHGCMMVMRAPQAQPGTSFNVSLVQPDWAAGPLGPRHWYPDQGALGLSMVGNLTAEM